MVNGHSIAYRFYEKAGLVIGKGLRYIILGGIAVFIGGKLAGSTPSQPAPAPPALLP
jgi:hypothetical protein